jgi:hypothetical protein
VAAAETRLREVLFEIEAKALVAGAAANSAREAARRSQAPQAWITGVVLVMFGCALLLLAFQEVPDINRDAFMLLVGALIALAKDAQGFYFNATEGSRSKDERLERLAQAHADNTALTGAR